MLRLRSNVETTGVTPPSGTRLFFLSHGGSPVAMRGFLTVCRMDWGLASPLIDFAKSYLRQKETPAAALVPADGRFGRLIDLGGGGLRPYAGG